ncbi:hypothetical protein TWF481_003735 [Arthrobotrys musiformis]|uniref:Uncharacterized protein n=1 Tax=Arthrobotrys musiformis TaxID=47236 RepID=A0AAV9WHI5_9PEZI
MGVGKRLAESLLSDSGPLKPQHINFRLPSQQHKFKERSGSIIGLTFYKAVAEYCRSKLPGEVEFSIERASDSLFLVIDVLDFQHLVDFCFRAEDRGTVSSKDRIMG